MIGRILTRHSKFQRIGRMPTSTSAPCPEVPDSTVKKVLTLALIDKDNKDILLGLKKRGFGIGLWNGFGGKVEAGEKIVDAAVREVKEECGLTVLSSDMDNFAVIHFEFVGDPVILEVHLFRCSKFSGEVVESEEMLPQWFPRNKVPHQKMWPDDEIWYPLYLSGTKFRAYFLFQGHDKIERYVIRDFNNPEKELQKSM